MDGIEVQGEGGQAVEPGKRTRRLWTAEEKRRMVRESQRPGAVRQEIAQRHGVNVSVLNRWRTEQRHGA
jgi:transposase